MSDENQQACPVFIITLEHSRARRETIASRLGELNLSFEFHRGVDGRELNMSVHPDYAPTKRRAFFGRDLSAGELGCVLAHRGLYQHMVEKRIPRAIVLEDDAIVTDDFPAVMNSLCRLPETWDLVRFLGRLKNYRSTRSIMPLEGASSSLSRPRGVPGGAYGYALNLHAAEQLLLMMRKNWLAIDTLHGVVWLTGLKTLSVMPSPVLPNDDIPSDIDELDDSKRWDKSVSLVGWRRLIYPVSRGLWKLYLNLNINFVWLKTWRQDAALRKRYVVEKSVNN